MYFPKHVLFSNIPRIPTQTFKKSRFKHSRGFDSIIPEVLVQTFKRSRLKHSRGLDSNIQVVSRTRTRTRTPTRTPTPMAPARTPFPDPLHSLSLNTSLTRFSLGLSSHSALASSVLLVCLFVCCYVLLCCEIIRIVIDLSPIHMRSLCQELLFPLPCLPLVVTCM